MNFLSSIDFKSKTGFLALRLMLILATALLLLPPGIRQEFPAFASLMIILFLLSNLVLAFLPKRNLFKKRSEFMLVVTDTFLVALGLFYANMGRPDLPVAFFVVLLLSAIGRDFLRIVMGATVVAVFYISLASWGRMGMELTGVQMLLRIPFLYITGLYYGAAVMRVLTEQKRTTRLETERMDLEALLEVTRATTSSLELQTVLKTIVQRVAMMVDAIRCSIVLLKNPGNHCIVMASSDNLELDPLTLDLEKYPELRQAIDTRETVVINDVAEAPMMSDVRDALRKKNFGSILVVPLLFEKEMLGMLFVRTARSMRSFSTNEIKACQVVANASAHALKNAILFEQIRDEAKRRKATSEVLRNIMEHFPDLIFLADLNGVLTDFNCGGEALLGVTREKMIGTPASALFVGGELPLSLDKLGREGGSVSNSHVLMKRANGELRQGIAAIALLHDETGEPTGMVGICKDITEMKQAQKQLQQDQNLFTIERTSDLAQEMNNPLAGILGYAELLTRTTPDLRRKRIGEQISDSAIRCQSIVQNLLNISEKRPLDKGVQRVNEILEKTLEMIENQLREKNITVHLDFQSDLPKALVDSHKIQQVFMNILQNAEQAIASRSGRGMISIRSFQRGDRIIIEFEDDGPGIHPENLERVFDRFFTTKEEGEGAGLGLWVSHTVIREHGGKISAEPGQERGTRIVIELPAQFPVRGTLKSPQEGVRKMGPGKRVLAVDDEPVVLNLLVDALNLEGHGVDTAVTGRQALEKIARNKYDVILLDLRLPDMSGKEVYHFIKENYPELGKRIIFNSIDTVRSENKEFIECSGNPSLQKPFLLEELHRAISSLPAGPAPG